jgi:Protein of unknown function (DUF4232)/Aspartic acid proteinase inhibitor
LSFTAATFGQVITGGYKTVAKDNAGVVAAAEFAVSKRQETNSEQEGLELDSVDKAERQVVGGTNYRLCLTVSLEDESQQVQTVVYQSLKQEYSLTSWTVADCAETSSNKSKTDDSKLQTSGFVAAKKMSVANCAGEQLAFKEMEGDADMGGKRYGNYVFTNVSLKNCKLLGYPHFSLLNKAGKVMGSVAVTYDYVVNTDSEENGGKPVPVTLKPKQTAYFQIFYNDGMALDNKKPVPTSAKVSVKAPNTTREFVIKSAIQACCGVQVSFIHGGLPQ